MAELKAALRSRQLECHPDKCVGLSAAEQASRRAQFDALSRARLVLSEPESRKRYDAALRQSRLQTGSNSAPLHCTIPWSQFASTEEDPDPGEFYSSPCRCGGEFVIEGFAALAHMPFAPCYQCSLVAKMEGKEACKEENLKVEFQLTSLNRVPSRMIEKVCTRNYLIIAERLSMNPVTKEMIAEAVQWMNREQFNSLALERESNGNCGYLLCQNPWSEEELKQKYRIGLIDRRIYEVGNRRFFCSDWCYRASLHLARQIPTNPVWCGPLPKGPRLDLDYLPEGVRGRPGTTIVDALQNLRIASDVVDKGVESELCYTSSSSDDDIVHNDEDLELEELLNTDAKPPKKKTEPLKETPWNETIPSKGTGQIRERSTAGKSRFTEAVESVRCGDPSPARSRDDNAPLSEVVLSRLKEWITVEAVAVLHTPGAASEGDERHVEYAKSVREYLATAHEDDDDDDDENDGQPLTCTLPQVDSVSRRSYQQKLLMDSLMPTLRTILRRLEVSAGTANEKLHKFILKFNLTNTNLHLRPHETRLMSVSLLYLVFRDTPDAPFTHDQLIHVTERLGVLGNGDASAFLAEVGQIVDKLYEEFLDSPS